MTAEQRLFLVDAHAYLHRAYHALSRTQMKTRSGEPTWALYGFARMLLKLIKDEKPDYLAVCFDTPEPTFRHKAYKEYKANRAEADEDLKWQLAHAQELVAGMGFAAVAVPGYEADDLLATLAREGASEGLKVVLVSGDKDALQLVGGDVSVLDEAKGVRFDADRVAEKFKVRPRQMVDYLAIVGDASDNVPGVPGIGPVGAAKLLGRFGSLEALLKAAHKGHADISDSARRALVESEEKVLKTRELIRLHASVPVAIGARGCRVSAPEPRRLAETLSRFEFDSLLGEMGLPGRSPAPPAGSGRAVETPFQHVSPNAFLKAAQRAGAVSVAADKADQPDLLHGARPMAALGLPDGRAACFADADFERHREALAKLLGGDKPAKIGHDLKACKRLLREAGLEISGVVSDTMLAAYCLDPARSRYDLGSVLRAHSGADLPAEEPAKALARRAAALWALRERLEAELPGKGLDTLYRDIELPMLDVLADMEDAGIALDADYLRGLRAEFEAKILEIKREIDDLAGVEINPRSPKQLAELFYDKLGLPIVHKTKKGGRSTDEEALRALAPLHAVPARIIDYRELTKLQSTYVEGLLERVDARTGRIHSHFNQAGTATGRLSSLDPNLQNIPVRTPLGRKIRRAFTAGKGNVLLSADYSQIDLRALAHLSEDPVLRGAFERGDDIHLKTASEVFETPPDRIDREMRRRAKAVNFGIVYGQSAHGLSVELGIPRGEAQRYIKRYFERYRGVDAWIKRTLEAARRDGLVRTLLGRVRYLPDIGARNFQVRSFNERVAVNTPIQGTSADIIKAAMVNIHRKLRAGSEWNALLVLQVHDELIFELSREEAGPFGKWVKREMETALRLSVPVVVDVKTGANWQEMEALDQ
ncbi:MAG: DNA polymerase I [Elusimicrobiota bacterium]